MNGAEWLARALAGTGMSHVFFVESVMRRTLLQLGDLGVRPILAHSEKAAAYMADGYARVAGRPGVCMAQSVGAANLASGLQDPWLGRSPVIALTGHKEPSFQHRNSYQEIPHAPLFQPVTKFSTPVYATSELPRLLRHAWRAALSDTPRPTHLDFNGLQGDVIELGQTGRAAGHRNRGAAHSAAPAGCRRARHRARRFDADRRAPPRDRRRRRRRRVRGRAGSAGAGRGARRPGRDDAGGARHHPDDAPSLGRGRRQLFGAARQPHRARRRHGAVRRLRHRRPGHAELDASRRSTPRSSRSRPTRSKSAAPIRTRPGSSATRRRHWRGSTRSSARPVARRFLRRGSGADRRRLARRHGGAGREEHGADRRRAAVRRDHPRLAGATACWSPTPAIPGSGPAR